MKTVLIFALLCLTLAAEAVRADEFALLPRLRHSIAVIGHRGGRAMAPENTLAAFRNAIKLGADYGETARYRRVGK